MTPNIRKIKRLCDKLGIQFEVAPKSLTGLNTGYLIIDNSKTNSDFFTLSDTPEEYFPKSYKYWEES